MANINQIITLGIGTPSSIKHFILFGLNTTIIGTTPVSLSDRYFGDVNLFGRNFGSSNLAKRNFGSATVGDKP